MPNGAIIETATVISATNNNYTVTLKPFDCRDQFPLIELTNSKVMSLNISKELQNIRKIRPTSNLDLKVEFFATALLLNI